MDATPSWTSVAWTRSKNDGIWIYVLGVSLALAVAGIGFLISFRDPQAFLDALDLTSISATIGLTLAIVVGHEAVHGLGYLAFGGRPRFSFGVSQAVGPAFWCTAPGQSFSVSRYVAVALAPTVVVNGALVAGLLSDAGWVFIMPLALHLAAGCVEDWFTAARALNAPQGSLIEDIKDGLIIHAPAPAIA